METPEYDFKGNPKAVTRRFALEFRTPLDWSAPPVLEADEFTGRTEYDALNRPRSATLPDGSRLEMKYGADGRLDGVTGVLAGSPGAATVFVAGIDHDAKGQRTRVGYGNGTATAYDYDPLTYRLRRLVTRRSSAKYPDDERTPPPAGFPGQSVQSLSYTYDPVGNITAVRDDAQQTVFFANKRVEPSCEYAYDALYRLTEATGREHCGQTGGAADAPTAPDAWNAFHANRPHPGDGQALGRYVERYVYDLVGNFVSVTHAGTEATGGTWTRTYDTDPASNRLRGTQVSGGPAEAFTHDDAGNVFGFGHLAGVTYDHRHQMRTSAKGRRGRGGDDALRLRRRRAAGAQSHDRRGRHGAAGAALRRRVRGLPRIPGRRPHGETGADDGARHGRPGPHRASRIPHRRRRRHGQATDPLPVRQPPRHGQPGTGRRRPGHHLRGVHALRQHQLPSRERGGKSSSQALPLHRQRARRGDGVQLPRGAVLRALAGAVDHGRPGGADGVGSNLFDYCNGRTRSC